MEICNLVLAPFNEVQFTQSTFSSPTGFHLGVKVWVNQAIRDIYQAEVEWPFCYKSREEKLVPEQNTYDYPADVQRVDWESFFLNEDKDLKVAPKYLYTIQYDAYNRYNRASDEQNPRGIRVPNNIVQMPDLKWGVTPIPDRAYTISYDYYGYSTELSNFDDIPDIPERFKDVIVNRALYDAYMFRDNWESAGLALERYKRGLAHMRTILINKYLRINDTRVVDRQRGFVRLGE